MAIDQKQASKQEEGGPLVPAPERRPAVRSYALPARVQEELEPERMVKFEELVGAEDIVILGTYGRDFDAGMGTVRRILWQWAEHFKSVGPDRDLAMVSLVSVGSIPARVGGEVEESGRPVLCRVEMRESKRNRGHTYYVLV